MHMLPLLSFVGSESPGSSPVDTRIPPLKIKTLLEPSPLKSSILARRLAARPVRSIGA